jgi:endoglucanase
MSAGFADSTIFSALAISNGELLFPGYVVNITDMKVNGETYALTGKPFTTSDDDKTTRVNIFNDWVTAIPDGARTVDGNMTGVSPSIVDAASLGYIQTMSVTFDYESAK